tara:strand:+ start:1181 stop:1756 length:576 start_codon:yes stop_codon:yes gene_type:complete
MGELNKEVRQSYLNKARTDKFRVIIPLPAILRNKDTRNIRSSEFVDKDSINFSIFAIDIPTIAVDSKDIPFAGQTPRLSSLARTPFDPVSVKFVIDNMYANYWLLYTWLNLIHDESSGHMLKSTGGSQPLDQYTTDIIVTGIDEYNNNVIEYKFSHCVPTEIGGINYDYQQVNEIESTFKFRFHQLKIKII